MMLAASPHRSQSRRTAFLVMTSDDGTALCPFFGKCDGLLLIDPDNGSREFHANTEHTAETMCDVILEAGVNRLVLGFIAGPAARKLRTAGVDIRLGSCACAVEDLALHFDVLPAL
jgi:predicted Fe-Mo cluster-binding NifX family protein